MTATADEPRQERPKALLAFALDNLVWLILLVALACFAIFIPKFFQIGILLNIIEQSTFVGIIAVGLSLTLIAGQMDLSIESVMALAAMLVALTFGTGGAGGGLALDPPWLASPAGSSPRARQAPPRISASACSSRPSPRSSLAVSASRAAPAASPASSPAYFSSPRSRPRST